MATNVRLLEEHGKLQLEFAEHVQRLKDSELKSRACHKGQDTTSISHLQVHYVI